MSAEPPAHEGAVHDDHERQEGESDADRDAERGDRGRRSTLPSATTAVAPSPARTTAAATASAARGRRSERDELRLKDPATIPASIMVSAARPSGFATGGTSSTTQPAARPTSAPCSGPRITAVATTPMSTRSGTKCDGTPRRGSTVDDERGHNRVCGAQEPEHREPHPASARSVPRSATRSTRSAPAPPRTSGRCSTRTSGTSTATTSMPSRSTAGATRPVTVPRAALRSTATTRPMGIPGGRAVHRHFRGCRRGRPRAGRQAAAR